MTLVIGCRPHLDSTTCSHLKVFKSIILAKTLFLNQIAFTWFLELGCEHIFLAGHHSAHWDGLWERTNFLTEGLWWCLHHLWHYSSALKVGWITFISTDGRFARPPCFCIYCSPFSFNQVGCWRFGCWKQVEEIRQTVSLVPNVCISSIKASFGQFSSVLEAPFIILSGFM